MRLFFSFLCVVFCLTSTVWSQQLLVFPAVVDEVSGKNNSLWVTVVSVVKKNPLDSVTVQRKWVCLPGGGFADDPALAPSWDLTGTGPEDRMFLAWGGELLDRTDSQLGAVALEVDGGEVIAHAYVADASQGFHVDGVESYGLGQLIAANREPQVGPSHIPWLPGCLNMNCISGGPNSWEYMRNNVGILNPNPEPLEITGEVVVFSNQEFELQYETEAFVREIQPYQWVQFHWFADQDFYGLDDWGGYYFPNGGFILNLVPDRDLPYFAYASTVFSPRPNNGFPDLSDPMFVPAEPGYVPSFYDSPPKTGNIGRDQDRTPGRRE